MAYLITSGGVHLRNRQRPLFGTQLTSAAHAPAEYAAGLRMFMYEIKSRLAQPTQGTFDSTYIGPSTSTLSDIMTIKGTGSDSKLILSMGLQYSPAWLIALSNNKSQIGTVSIDPNYPFSETVCVNGIDNYVAELGTLGYFNYVDYIRLGFDLNGELLFQTNPGSDGYWAFCTEALTGTGLNTYATANPYPNFLPGASTAWAASHAYSVGNHYIQGTSQYIVNTAYTSSSSFGSTDTTNSSVAITAAQVSTWLNWYISIQIGLIKRTIDKAIAAGFTGRFQVLMPGQGTKYTGTNSDIAAWLPIGSSHYLTIGAAWHLVAAQLAALPAKYHNVIDFYCSSNCDGSGTPANNAPTASDVTTYTPATVPDTFSSARFITFLANYYSFPMGGENPGSSGGGSTYYLDPSINGMMAQSTYMAFEGNWAYSTQAHEFDLFTVGNANGDITLAQYVAAIAMSERGV